MTITENIEKEISAICLSHDISQHQAAIVSEKGGLVLRLMLKRADGTMDLDTCEQVSQELSEYLDANPFTAKPYQLDVCSYGAEAELAGNDEIAQAVGQYIYVKFDGGYEGMADLYGDLTDYKDGILTLNYNVKNIKKTISIPQTRMIQIRLAVKM